MLKSNFLSLYGVITEEDKLSDQMIDILQKRNIKIFFIQDKDDLDFIINSQKKFITCFVMYFFDIIIPAEIAQNNIIINIHSGDLKNNRGRNPISWSILLSEKELIISIHKISGDIDKGILISKIKIPITEQDDYFSLNKKVIAHWFLIEQRIFSYLLGEITGETITEGCYRRAIKETDYTINLEKDSNEQIVQKIKSQKSYKGAIINTENLKLYVTDWQYK